MVVRAAVEMQLGMQHDEKGSATALLHLCVKVSDEQFLFFFACLGDTEARTPGLIASCHSF